jgi:hypothetical protein
VEDQKKSWRRVVHEEDGTVGKTWTEFMATVGNTVRWCCFVEDFCSEMEEKELT